MTEDPRAEDGVNQKHPFDGVDQKRTRSSPKASSGTHDASTRRTTQQASTSTRPQPGVPANARATGTLGTDQGDRECP